jgi:Dual specificity phosphatase, catalytic domain
MRRPRTYIYIALAILIIGGGVAQFGGVYFRWFRAPYNIVGKAIAWTIGIPETAYNFDVVVPGRLYRSGLPDARFLDYVRRRYGIQHVVSLSGASKIHRRAKELGMNVTVLHWRKDKPPAQDLKMLLTLFDGNERILVHCRAGRDRSGYAIAIYRMSRQHWPLEQAIQDMEAHGHSPRHRSETDRVLSESLRELTDQRVEVPQSELDSRRPKHSTTPFTLTLKPGISKRAT